MGYYRTLIVIIPFTDVTDHDEAREAESRLKAKVAEHVPDLDWKPVEIGGGVLLYAETAKWVTLDLIGDLTDMTWPAGTTIWSIGEQSAAPWVEVYGRPSDKTSTSID